MTSPTIPEVLPEAAVPSASGTTRDASDGRIALRLRNRQRVIDALIHLVSNGNDEPSMAEIIEQAEVSERSVFRYFNDITDLVLTSMWSMLARVEPERTIANIGEGPLEDRIDAWISSRLAVTRQTLPFATLVGRFRTTPEFESTVLEVVAIVRQQIAAQFAPELADRSADEREQILDLLMSISSLESFVVFTKQLHCNEDQVRQRLTLMLRAVFADSA